MKKYMTETADARTVSTSRIIQSEIMWGISQTGLAPKVNGVECFSVLDDEMQDISRAIGDMCLLCERK